MRQKCNKRFFWDNAFPSGIQNNILKIHSANRCGNAKIQKVPQGRFWWIFLNFWGFWDLVEDNPVEKPFVAILSRSNHIMPGLYCSCVHNVRATPLKMCRGHIPLKFELPSRRILIF